MRHEQIHAMLEERTKKKWRCERHINFDYNTQGGRPKDTLYLFDDRGVLRKYYLEDHKPFYPISSKLKDFATSLNFNLTPAYRLRLDNITPINVPAVIYNKNFILSFKPAGTLTVEGASPNAVMNYTLWGGVSSSIEQTNAINNFLTDATSVKPEYDPITNKVKLEFEKSLSVGPLTVTLSALDLKTFTGSISFTLKKDYNRYNGWKFNGDMSFVITAKKSDDDFTGDETPLYKPVLSSKTSAASYQRSYVSLPAIMFGGLVLVGGAACFLTGGAAIAVLGFGGSLAYISA